MQVRVYRSSKKDGMYIYVADEDALEKLPEAVKQQLGEAEFALELELSKDRHLESANAKDVLRDLDSQGFYIQMPKDIEAILADISRRSR